MNFSTLTLFLIMLICEMCASQSEEESTLSSIDTTTLDADPQFTTPEDEDSDTKDMYKCCPSDQILHKNQCQNTSFDHYLPVTNNKSCSFDQESVSENSTGINYVQENGFIISDRNIGKGLSKYCIENWLPDEESEDTTIIILKCLETGPTFTINDILHVLGMLLSLPFLIATLAVYLTLPKLQTVHGKSLMCYVGSLTLAYIILIVLKLSNDFLTGTICEALGYIAYYCFILNFFWLSVISFDIWWLFSRFEGYKCKIFSTDRMRYIFYAFFAFCGSLLFCMIPVVVHYQEHIPTDFKYGVGENDCWIYESTVFPYLYAPLILLILIDVVLFSHVMVKIFQANYKKGSTKFCYTEEEKEKFWLYIKLFLIMGVSWSLEIVNYAMGSPIWLNVLSNLCNVVHGMIICLLFICNQKTKRMLRKRYSGHRRNLGPAHTNNSSFKIYMTGKRQENPNSLETKETALN